MGMILTNAKVHTVDPERSVADTVVIQHGRVTYVGPRDGWEGLGDLPVHDLGGRTVIPGFVDAHTHPSMVARSAWHVRLPWTDDLDEILDFIRDYAAAHPPEEEPYLYFEYYPSEVFRDRKPTKELLDSAVSDRPVLCQDFSEHEHWVNSKMLELMEIGPETPDPVPGLEMFFRDDAGEPTGRLREWVHMHYIDRMFEKLRWTPPEELTPERVEMVFRFLSHNGVTALFDALVEDDEILVSIAELERAGRLPLFYEGALRFRHSSDLPETISRLQSYDAKYGGERIRMKTLKLFLDGTNEGANSALIAPMCGHANANATGEIGMEVEELTDSLVLCNQERVDVHIHVTGDRAFRVACDAVEAAQARVAEDGEAWASVITLAHCELVDPADVARPADLGIFVNWTPHWSGGYFGELSKGHLGEERWNGMYRFNEIAESGATLTFSSDVVSSYELHRAAPLYGIQIGMTRVDPEFPLDPARHPGSVRPPASSTLSFERLLAGYTIDAARQLRLDDRLGSLEVGKIANLSVLADDPFSVSADEMSTVRIDAVVFEGRLVSGALPTAVAAAGQNAERQAV